MKISYYHLLKEYCSERFATYVAVPLEKLNLYALISLIILDSFQVLKCHASYEILVTI